MGIDKSNGRRVTTKGTRFKSKATGNTKPLMNSVEWAEFCKTRQGLK